MATIAIVVPSRDQVHADFAVSLAQIMVRTVIGRVSCSIINVRGASVAHQRNALVDEAMKDNPTHLMWLDSDIVAPDDTIIRLLGHDKDVVCATYRTRVAPDYKINGRFIDRHEGALCRAEIMPMGCMLVKAEVYQKLPQPWHWESYDGAPQAHGINHDLHSEDANFCALARKFGYDIWCDMGLTTEIKHLAQMELAWHVA